MQELANFYQLCIDVYLANAQFYTTVVIPVLTRM